MATRDPDVDALLPLPPAVLHILIALACTQIPRERRTAGIAIVATGIGGGKLLSSIAFGALWQAIGVQNSVLVFAGAMAAALLATFLLLRSTRDES